MLKTDRQKLVLRMGTASFCRRDGRKICKREKGQMRCEMEVCLSLCVQTTDKRERKEREKASYIL